LPPSKTYSVKAGRVPSIELVRMALAETSLKHFVQYAWPVVEPATEYIPGWHIDAICEHLEAVSKNQIKHLIINIPPRHMKSLIVSVFWPCWEWIARPELRWLYSSYAQDLSTRDSLKCRRLIQSLWYQSQWSDKFAITSDQNQKTRFENDKTGYRLATSVDGLATGEGGDRVVVDDAHNVKKVESPTIREGTILWWDESMSTRLSTPKTGHKIVVMHRTHYNDLTGHILAGESKKDYAHLCLPARYEKKALFDMGKKDPRTKEKEPLWKPLYGEKELTDLQRAMGSYAFAGQFMQTPTPRGGGMFKVDKLEIIDYFNRVTIKRSVRYWDKAGTQDGGKYSCGVLIHELEDKSFLVEHVVRGRWTAGIREAHIKLTAEKDSNLVATYVEQEGGSGGKESAESTVQNLRGYRIKADNVTGSKEVRAEPFSAQVEIGNVKLLKAPWNKEYKAELQAFPNGSYLDQVDASSGGFNKLTLRGKRAGAWGSN